MLFECNYLLKIVHCNFLNPKSLNGYLQLLEALFKCARQKEMMDIVLVWKTNHCFYLTTTYLVKHNIEALWECNTRDTSSQYKAAVILVIALLVYFI